MHVEQEFHRSGRDGGNVHGFERQGQAGNGLST